MILTEITSQYPDYDSDRVRRNYRAELERNQSKIVVLDDDPTGVQTVHDIYVHTTWDRSSIRDGLDDRRKLFYILTNSRAFDSRATVELHREIASSLLLEQAGDAILVSRSDSTLRGHYPAETETLRDALEQSGYHLDGEIIYPFFPEGGRYTIDQVHYVEENGQLVPAAETEFARDRTFGYTHSNLAEWVEEKTGGRFRASDVTAITLAELRALDYDSITAKLMQVHDFGKVTVDSVSYEDVMVFATAFYRALAAGKRFIFRSAAALVQILGGIEKRPLLSGAELRQHGNQYGGLIIIGSHVQKTSRQLEKLRSRDDIEFIEMNQHLVIDAAAFDEEAERVKQLARRNILAGRTVAVYTRRDRFDLNTGNKEDELRCAAAISDKLTDVVRSLDETPSFIIGKGGITSSDIGTKGLSVRKALVMGQILPGIPVWLTGPESRFPGLPYVIFPGNVGDEYALLEAVRKLKGESET